MGHDALLFSLIVQVYEYHSIRVCCLKIRAHEHRGLLKPLPPSTLLVGQGGKAMDPEAISTIPQYHGPARDAIAAACRYVR